MRCRVNLQSDPISLTIIAAEGKEHTFLDAIGDGGFVEVEIAAQTKRELQEMCAQLQVQLAGCAVAALGGSPQAAVGDYGWSPAYRDVVELRKLYDKAVAELEELRRLTTLAVDLPSALPKADRAPVMNPPQETVLPESAGTIEAYPLGRNAVKMKSKGLMLIGSLVSFLIGTLAFCLDRYETAICLLLVAIYELLASRISG